MFIRIRMHNNTLNFADLNSITVYGKTLGRGNFHCFHGSLLYHECFVTNSQLAIGIQRSCYQEHFPIKDH